MKWKRIVYLVAGTFALWLMINLVVLPGLQAQDNTFGGEVIINEIMQNPSAVSDSAGEWFELFNVTDSDIDINGWTISDLGIDSHVIANGGPLTIPAGGFLVLGINDDSTTNGGVTVDYEYSGFFLANGDDEIVLLQGTTEIDRVEYDGGPNFPDPTGASMALKEPGLDNNAGGNWCTSSTPFGDGDLGTPGASNDCSIASPGDVIINEIMQNPSAVSDSAGEWFELFNVTDSDIDINAWTISDLGSDSHVIANGGPLTIPAGGFLVLGINDDSTTNGGVTVDYQYSGFLLANGDDEIVLLQGTTEIDRVEYDGGPNFPDPTGASMALRDPALDNNVGGNWCESTTPFGDGDLGTPGAPNDCAALNLPPDCSNASASVDTIWPANHRFVAVEILGVTDPDGDEVTITIDSIYQDEPVDSSGDGSFSPDGTGVCSSTAYVRAERVGSGNGRVYTIDFTAEDEKGGACTGEVLVGVPKNQGRNGTPVDDGAQFDSTMP